METVTMEALAFFPGRRRVVIKLTQNLTGLAEVGKIERDGKANTVLDRLYYEGDNDIDGVFLIGDQHEVRVYKTARDGFKRVA